VGYSPWSCRESDTTEHTHSPVRSHLNLTTSAGMLFPGKVTFTGSGWMWILWGGWWWSTVQLSRAVFPGDTDIENRLVNTEGKERVGRIERVAWKHIHCHMLNR